MKSNFTSPLKTLNSLLTAVFLPVFKHPRSISFLAMILCFSTLSLAQQTISGTVTDDETKETLIGVNILIEGSSTGTTTDVNGSFKLEVGELPATLIFSYTGYQDQKVIAPH